MHQIKYDENKMRTLVQMNADSILELQKSFSHIPICSRFRAKNLKGALKTTHFIGTHTQFKIFIKFLFLSAVLISDNTSSSLLGRCSLSGINHKLSMCHNTCPPLHTHSDSASLELTRFGSYDCTHTRFQVMFF